MTKVTQPASRNHVQLPLAIAGGKLRSGVTRASVEATPRAITPFLELRVESQIDARSILLKSDLQAAIAPYRPSR